MVDIEYIDKVKEIVRENKKNGIVVFTQETITDTAQAKHKEKAQPKK